MHENGAAGHHYDCVCIYTVRDPATITAFAERMTMADIYMRFIQRRIRDYYNFMFTSVYLDMELTLNHHLTFYFDGRVLQ